MKAEGRRNHGQGSLNGIMGLVPQNGIFHVFIVESHLIPVVPFSKTAPLMLLHDVIGNHFNNHSSANEAFPEHSPQESLERLPRLLS